MKVGDLVRNRVKSSDARVENEIGRVTAIESDVLFGYEERFGRRFPIIGEAITVQFPNGMTHTRAVPSHYVYA